MSLVEVERFCEHLRLRHYAHHTIESYRLDLRLFFAAIDKPLRQISWRDVGRFIAHQHHQGLAPTTINRRLHALKRFFDFLVLDQAPLAVNPVKPSHYLKQGRALPKKLSAEPIAQLFATIEHPMDRALFLLMLRCGLRVSEVAALKVSAIDWEQQALLVEQGKGRKDRVVYLSADAVTSLRECWQKRPPLVPGEYVFWNQKRTNRPLSIKAIQKKMARYAKKAGIAASCHRLRHTFASELLEQGVEIVSIRELLGHSSMTSSERYAKVSNQQVKQEYLRTMQKILRRSKV
jgi:site-specific recombinase XerD